MAPPSADWTSYEGWDEDWDHDGLKSFIDTIDRSSLVEHAQLIFSRLVSISDRFHVGVDWCLYELLTSDERIIIARMRLPKHPNAIDANEDSEKYAIECEVATMRFLQNKVKSIPCPKLYAYEDAANTGPFTDSGTYFAAAAEGRICPACRDDDTDIQRSQLSRLAPFVFHDIVDK